MKKYARFLEEGVAYQELKNVLEKSLGRNLTELEQRKIKWLAGCEYETVGVIVDLFKELSREGAE